MPPKKIGTFEEIQSAKDLPDVVTVEVPEWGFAVKVRGLKRSEVMALRGEIDEQEGSAKTIQMGLVEPQITLEQAREMCNEKSFQATERVVEAVMKASGLGDGFRS